jgi:hypothetical protein
VKPAVAILERKTGIRTLDPHLEGGGFRPLNSDKSPRCGFVHPVSTLSLQCVAVAERTPTQWAIPSVEPLAVSFLDTAAFEAAAMSSRIVADLSWR